MEESDTACNRQWRDKEGYGCGETAALFRQIFLGMSYEESFFDGLNVNTLKEKFDYLYSMLKA